MKKVISRLKAISIVLFTVELLSIIFVGVCYFNKFLRIDEILNEELIFIIFSSIIALNILWLWTLLIAFNTLKKKTDLKIADLIGQDIAEAYSFGMIGLVVVDQDNTVLWINELLKERQIDILNLNILDWQPKLENLINSPQNTTEKLLINSRNYETKYLKDAGLFIFKDITDLENISDFSRKQSTVVGQIIIDNYADISSNGDDSDEVLSETRSIIVSYCKEHGVVLRKMRSDCYFMLCNYENLQKMEADKFSLLNSIRIAGQNEMIPPTISIGIAYDFPDLIKLNDMASNAIEIAMSRGGDQVVISRYGEDIAFFGGKSIAQETHNKVKTRVMAGSIISLIKAASNVVIMGHQMMDMDALGSCLGMKSICDYCQKEALVVYDPKKVEKKTNEALIASFSKDEMSFFVNETKALNEIRNDTLLIVCDVHKGAMTISQKVVEKANKIMIIDHHRRGEEIIESPIFAIIDPSASSTCEIVAELISYAAVNPRINIKPEYATIMLSGIFLDSNYFKNSTSGSKAFEASMILRDFGADNTLADNFLKDEFEEYALINKIISTLKTPYYGIVYCVSSDDDIIDQATIAKVANQCMQMKGVNACFVIGRTGADEVKISCRSDNTVNVQILAEKLNGGGHFTQAAGVFNKISVIQAESKLLDVLDEHLNDARSIKGGK